MNFSFFFSDLGLVQYPYDIVKERVYIKALLKVYKRFLDNEEKNKQIFKRRNKITSQAIKNTCHFTPINQANRLHGSYAWC